ncbi:hypothetical protein GQ55_3G240600 [Panicum hallii var. hallii]|uniref:Uncharacterized protein n=1 Tax=Panicum hallii var. hallii TaxID=1504633 RepID=A0A2T7ECU9_9POAL|nr:hypothetical protein GQ55_3G240600 [Panicum hallii var. hallii]
MHAARRRDGLIARLTVLIRHHGSGLALVPAGRLCFVIAEEVVYADDPPRSHPLLLPPVQPRAQSHPHRPAGAVTYCSGGRGRVAVGCDDGTVGLLDRGFRLSYGFQAHASSVLFLQQLKQRNVLVTVGDDDQSSLQSSAICLKVFDLDKVQEEGSSTTTPFCVQILRVFTDHFPQAKITSFMVLEEAPPILLIAIGLDNGFIYCIKGDIARECITRFKLQVEAASNGSTSLPITGLGF